jgi:hypothetical protein
MCIQRKGKESQHACTEQHVRCTLPFPNQVRCFYLSQRRKNCKQNLVSYETSELTVETIEQLSVRKISHHASCWRRKHDEILERNPTCSPLKTESSSNAG